VAAEEGRIVLTIAVKRDTLLGTVEAAGLNAPRIGTRQTITQVRIPDGGTVVISGLREDRATNQTEGLPWVKNIPVLGWLFKNELTDASRFELMIFLTAKVIESPGEASASPQELPGAPGAPGRTGQAPSPAAALPAVSSAAPVTDVRPAASQTEVLSR
jgi:type II secretory pathway component GspD/PulD (secretin)